MSASEIDREVSAAENALTAARADLEAAKRAHTEAGAEFDQRYQEMVAAPSDKVLAQVERADTRRHRTELAERAATERVARAEKALAIAKGRRRIEAANALRSEAHALEQRSADRLADIVAHERALHELTEQIIADADRARELVAEADKLAPGDFTAHPAEEWLRVARIAVQRERVSEERTDAEALEPFRWIEPLEAPEWNDRSVEADRVRETIAHLDNPSRKAAQ